jgi:hypothetical protein
VKVEGPPPVEAPEPATTVEVDDSAKKRQTAKLTLKVKPGSRAGGTVKLPGLTPTPPAPAPAAKTVPVEAPPAAPDSGATVKLEPPPAVPAEEEAAPKKKKGLSFKRKSQEQPAATVQMPGETAEQPAAEEAETVAPATVAMEAADEPGTVLSVLTLVATVAVLFAAGIAAYQVWIYSR